MVVVATVAVVVAAVAAPYEQTKRRKKRRRGEIRFVTDLIFVLTNEIERSVLKFHHKAEP